MHRSHGFGHRAEMDRDVLRLRDHATVLVEQCGRAVAALLDVRRERRPDERGAHLLRDRTERCADDLQLDRITATSAGRASRVGPSRPPSRRESTLSRRRAPAPRAARGRAAGPRRRRAAPAHLGGSHRDELDRAGAVRVAVARFVRLVEPLLEPRAERHRQLERLSGVAEVRLAVGGELARVGERRDVRAHGVSPLVGGDQAERRENTRGGRYEDGRHPELLGERARVQRAGAAERDEREVARIEALLDGHDTQRADHLGVHDVDHGGRVDRAERALGGAPVELDAARAAPTGSRPRRRFASVTVGRVPPRP